MKDLSADARSAGYGSPLGAGDRPAVLVIFVFAAIATPTPDPFTMFLLAIPLCLLYAGALVVATILDRRRAKNRPDWAQQELSDDEASTL